jgi:hypothetical protein
MASPSPNSAQPAGGAVRTGVIGTLVAAFAFFDGVVLGAPVALLAASFSPLIVYVVATTAAILLVIACCSWVDRRWEGWLLGNRNRIGKRLEAMRASRLMKHPVAWIERGSDRWYAFAAAVANPILVLASARSMSGKPVGERRILLGSVAYAIPYVAIWSFVGWAIGDAVRDA